MQTLKKTFLMELAFRMNVGQISKNQGPGGPMILICCQFRYFHVFIFAKSHFIFCRVRKGCWFFNRLGEKALFSSYTLMNYYQLDPCTEALWHSLPNSITVEIILFLSRLLPHQRLTRRALAMNKKANPSSPKVTAWEHFTKSCLQIMLWVWQAGKKAA